MPYECKSNVSHTPVIVKNCNNLIFRLSCYANSIISILILNKFHVDFK